MNFAQAIRWKYPNANPLSDFRVEIVNGVSYLVDWNLPDPKPNDEEIYAWWVEFVRESKLRELADACQADILAGLHASNGHTYQFDFKDQDNISQQLTLMLLDPTISVIPWKTMDSGIVNHTRAEFITVARDAEAHKRNNMGRYWQLEARVKSAMTDTDILPIKW